MRDIAIALGFVVALNMVFFIAQESMININPDAQIIFTYDGSMISASDAGEYTINENITNQLPDSPNAITIDSDGTVITDMFSTIKSWFLNTSGGYYLSNIINAVPNFIKILGMPAEIAYALGWFWHVLVFFLVVMFLKGDT